MFCTKCGNQLRENARFCLGCGTPVEEIEPKSSRAVADSSTVQAYQPQEESFQGYSPSASFPTETQEEASPVNFYAYQETPAPLQPIPASPTPKKPKKVPLLISLCVLSLAVVVVAVGWLYNNSQNATRNNRQTERYTTTYNTEYTTIPTTESRTSATTTTTQPTVSLTTMQPPAAGGDNNYTVTTSGDSLLIRSGPSQEFSPIGKIPNSTVVTVAEIRDNWAYLTYDGISGWSSMDYLKISISAPEDMRLRVETLLEEFLSSWATAVNTNSFDEVSPYLIADTEFYKNQQRICAHIHGNGTRERFVSVTVHSVNLQSDGSYLAKSTEVFDIIDSGGSTKRESYDWTYIIEGSSVLKIKNLY